MYDCKTPQLINPNGDWVTVGAACAVPTTKRVQGNTLPVYDKPEEPPTHRLEDNTWRDLAVEQGATNADDQAKKLIQACVQYHEQILNGLLEPKAHFES